VRDAPLRSIVRDARMIVRLGGPLIANNLAVAGMAFADTVMAGRLGAVDLGAVAIGSSYFNLWLFVGLGILMAVAPCVAHARGAGDDLEVGRLFRQSIWLALGLGAGLVLGVVQAARVLEGVGVAASLLGPARLYCIAIAFGMPGLMLFFALRFTSEGIGWTRPVMYVAVLGLVANVFGNWVFMYGHLGAPALGAAGCGVASAIVMWLMAFAMGCYVVRHRVYRSYRLFARVEGPDRRRLGELLGIGVPIAGSIVCEGGLFVTAALLIGTLGATVVAAHQIAINYATFTFMLPLALHSATTIRVGHELGAARPQAARQAGIVGIALCGGVMLVSALALVLLNESIAAIYTRDRAVLDLAASLLMLAAVFQVSDGLQVGAAGALRGYKDTRVPLLLSIVSYWFVGFPVAWWLGVRAGQGPVGVWIGLVAGLCLAAVLLNVRFRAVAARALAGAAQQPAGTELEAATRIRDGGAGRMPRSCPASEVREGS
jgi:MATE family multidrug resistance protein